jgi:Zn-dependent oligopeptidase
LAAQSAVSKVNLVDIYVIILKLRQSDNCLSFDYLMEKMQGHENATAENGPWVITLDAPSYIAVMQHARNRSLREEVYRAYITRASSGDLDNTLLIEQILKLRLEKAKLLNYNNYAEV